MQRRKQEEHTTVEHGLVQRQSRQSSEITWFPCLVPGVVLQFDGPLGHLCQIIVVIGEELA